MSEIVFGSDRHEAAVAQYLESYFVSSVWSARTEFVIGTLDFPSMPHTLFEAQNLSAALQETLNLPEIHLLHEIVAFVGEALILKPRRKNNGQLVEAGLQLLEDLGLDIDSATCGLALSAFKPGLWRVHPTASTFLPQTWMLVLQDVGIRTRALERPDRKFGEEPQPDADGLFEDCSNTGTVLFVGSTLRLELLRPSTQTPCGSWSQKGSKDMTHERR